MIFPDIIKSKIAFYLWKINNKILNKEYRKKYFIYTNRTTKIEYLFRFPLKDNKSLSINSRKLLINQVGPYCYKDPGYHYINNFINYIKYILT